MSNPSGAALNLYVREGSCAAIASVKDKKAVQIPLYTSERAGALIAYVRVAP